MAGWRRTRCPGQSSSGLFVRHTFVTPLTAPVSTSTANTAIREIQYCRTHKPIEYDDIQHYDIGVSSQAFRAACSRASAVRDEASRTSSVKLCHETFGSSDDPTVLLIMGLGAQMLQWPAELCERIAARGFHVVRFDNRDIGLSPKSPETPVLPTFVRIAKGVMSSTPGPAPYDLHDMAADAITLLDRLGVGCAHVAGASMGGLIAQIMAVDYQDRVASLALLATHANQRFAVPTTPWTLVHMVARASFAKHPFGMARDQWVGRMMRTFDVIAGPANSVTDVFAQAEFEAMWARHPDSWGILRQLDACVSAGNLLDNARQITQPTVVIHGRQDTLVKPESAQEMAAAIPGSRLQMVNNMGHLLPRNHWNLFINELTRNAASTAS